MPLSFADTQTAFAHKTDSELQKAKRLFKTIRQPWLANLGTRLTPYLMKTKMPISGLIKNTIFKQFVGGEQLSDLRPLINTLKKRNVDIILDYGAETQRSVQNFEANKQEFINAVSFAAQQGIPFISIKITALARFELLEALHAAPRLRSGIHENEIEDEEWKLVKQRVNEIFQTAMEHNIGVLVDAEESWIQDPIDKLTIEAMEKYNKQNTIVFNTYQLYRSDRLRFLQLTYKIAQNKNFKFGVKLVRGAYMEKERKRAAALGYKSPIHLSKAAVDKDYNEAILFCIDKMASTTTIIASHNEDSTALAVDNLSTLRPNPTNSAVHFSQLYGMSDHITFNLAAQGYSVSKYVPYGPLKKVIPYLMRRAQENSSIGQDTGRQLAIIEKELARRKAIK